MLTAEQHRRMADLIESQYNGYRGRIFQEIKRKHNEICDRFGYEFLLYHMEKSALENPLPVYEIPKEFYITTPK